MKITCTTLALLPALRTAARAVSPRATMPILGTILLRASGGRLHIAATDLELGLETSCEAEVAEPGAIALPARLLAEIVASLPEGQVQIGSSETGATITADATRFDLASIVVDDRFVGTGSFNWTREAECCNWENLVVLDDPALARAFEAEFKRLWGAQ